MLTSQCHAAAAVLLLPVAGPLGLPHMLEALSCPGTLPTLAYPAVHVAAGLTHTSPHSKAVLPGASGGSSSTIASTPVLTYAAALTHC